jgi:hypothetical protein
MSGASEDEERLLRKLKRTKRAMKKSDAPAPAVKKVRRAIRRIEEVIDARS